MDKKLNVLAGKILLYFAENPQVGRIISLIAGKLIQSRIIVSQFISICVFMPCLNFKLLLIFSGHRLAWTKHCIYVTEIPTWAFEFWCSMSLKEFKLNLGTGIICLLLFIISSAVYFKKKEKYCNHHSVCIVIVILILGSCWQSIGTHKRCSRSCMYSILCMFGVNVFSLVTRC